MDNRNLIAALAIAALLTVAVTAAGCTTSSNPSPTPIPATQTTVGNNTTFSSGAGFNITYPKTLRIDSTTNASQPVKLYIYLNSSNVIDAVNVGTLDLKTGQTLQDFVNSNLNANQQPPGIQAYPNYQQISNQTNLTVSGKPAYNIVWQATVPVQLNTTQANTNMTLKVMQTYVINNNTGYVISYKAIPSNYNTYLAQAQRIINSFTLT